MTGSKQTRSLRACLPVIRLTHDASFCDKHGMMWLLLAHQTLPGALTAKCLRTVPVAYCFVVLGT